MGNSLNCFRPPGEETELNEDEEDEEKMGEPRIDDEGLSEVLLSWSNNIVESLSLLTAVCCLLSNSLGGSNGCPSS